MSDADKYLGETYRSRDWRSENRRIKIVAFDEKRGKYRAEPVNEYGQLIAELRDTFVTAKTIDTRYRKTSH